MISDWIHHILEGKLEYTWNKQRLQMAKVSTNDNNIACHERNKLVYNFTLTNWLNDLGITKRARVQKKILETKLSTSTLQASTYIWKRWNTVNKTCKITALGRSRLGPLSTSISVMPNDSKDALQLKEIETIWDIGKLFDTMEIFKL